MTGVSESILEQKVLLFFKWLNKAIYLGNLRLNGVEAASCPGASQVDIAGKTVDTI
jgi:hypothetical protein